VIVHYCVNCRWWIGNRKKLGYGVVGGRCGGWPAMTVGSCRCFEVLVG